MNIKRGVSYFIISGLFLSILLNIVLLYRLSFLSKKQSLMKQGGQESHKTDRSRLSQLLKQNLSPSQTSHRIQQRTAPPQISKKQDCLSDTLPEGYKLATSKDIYINYSKLSHHPLIFRIDLNSDGKKEEVRVLLEKISGERFLARLKPVIIQVLKKEEGCLKEVFRFGGGEGESSDNFDSVKRNGNEIGFALAQADFWGDGRDVFVFMPISTGYGSGYNAFLNILTFREGKYEIIEGPTLGELSEFKFSVGAAPGRAILVAHDIWEEGEAHFSPHRCRVEQWIWEEKKYVKEEVLTTKQKYSPPCSLDEILAREMN